MNNKSKLTGSRPQYSIIKQMFEEEGMKLIQIHSPANPLHSSKHEIDFIIKYDGRTYQVTHNFKDTQITKADIQQIKMKIAKGG